jgi:hypothetical protein
VVYAPEEPREGLKVVQGCSGIDYLVPLLLGDLLLLLLLLQHMLVEADGLPRELPERPKGDVLGGANRSALWNSFKHP